jgi:hypothetical protein
MNSRHIWKAILSGGAILTVATCGLLISSRNSQAANDKNQTQDEKLKIQIGQKANPVTLNLTGKDPDTVYLGSYIVNAGGCNDCHTNPSFAAGGDPYQGQPKQINAAGFLGGGQPFGPFTSRNITPDATGKPAGMTLAEFTQAIRTGIDFDHVHGPLLQVMPWPAFQNWTDRDMNAVYTYLSAIPCLEGDPGVDPNAPPRCH